MVERMQPERIVGGRYLLVGELGVGGFGRVWKAHDIALDVHVAVKEVRLPQQAGSDADRHERMVRAAREARNAARLRDHPHVVAVHDVVMEDGAPWIVMSLVDGNSLEKQLSTDGRLLAPLVTKTAVALLKGLQAAHAAGIVHRDLKPANVMLTDDGETLLTDFGIAVHETDTRLTTTGGIIGSAEYMAPERLKGLQDQAAGDLFSLGVTLYEAVEGISPFRRDSPAGTLTAVISEPPPPMRHADLGLAPLIDALLDKNPEDRPSVNAALAALSGSTLTITASASRPPPAGRAPAMPPLPTASVAVSVTSIARIGRLISGSWFLLAGISLIAFGCFMFIIEGGWEGAYPISLGAAALVAVLFGLAATFYRWNYPGKPPFRIAGGLFLPVFLSLAAIWTVWNTVLLW
ncbi:serine/threonine-protein kinase [Streptomyces sp. NP-1717]|uniref:serine/threonine-protein kinase n=1 Tax=Streptomyces sp. NP-1717 TaxID=2704470 RepID=UPI001F5D4723|nr:serine/threonine-protein kinase [Streptomyces sp. NP-1717]MCI3221987.1 serine/threonine protein kinase [Streptomyces sp. NP-1717]